MSKDDIFYLEWCFLKIFFNRFPLNFFAAGQLLHPSRLINPKYIATPKMSSTQIIITTSIRFIRISPSLLIPRLLLKTMQALFGIILQETYLFC